MSIRILHAPSSTGGNPQALSRALHMLGMESVSMVVTQNYLAYKADIVLHSPGTRIVWREIRRVWAIFFELPRYDVIHYNSGTTIASAYAVEFGCTQGLRGWIRQIYSVYLRGLQRIELAYLKLLGKTVFVTFQGDDARQGDYCLSNYAITFANRVEPGYYSRASDDFKRASISRFSEIANGIYSVNPDLLNVLPVRSRFVPYGHVFLNEWLPIYSQAHSGSLRILHAPSHRKVKGTDLILTALNELKARGYDFELLLVEGMSNANAKKIYASADILVDQLFAGWYGGLAVELMALGKPVLAYIRESDLHFIDNEMRADLPVINVNPSNIKSVLKQVLEMPRAELISLGVRSRLFVEKWHDPIKIANQIKEDYMIALSKDKRC